MAVAAHAPPGGGSPSLPSASDASACALRACMYALCILCSECVRTCLPCEIVCMCHCIFFSYYRATTGCETFRLQACCFLFLPGVFMRCSLTCDVIMCLIIYIASPFRRVELGPGCVSLCTPSVPSLYLYALLPALLRAACARLPTVCCVSPL